VLEDTSADGRGGASKANHQVLPAAAAFPLADESADDHDHALPVPREMIRPDLWKKMRGCLSDSF